MDGFRNAIRLYSPPWLATGTAESYLYTIGLELDAGWEKANQGVRASLPGAGTPTALALIGADLGLDRGPSETDDGFADRLTHALSTYRTDGSPYAVLRQVELTIGPATTLKAVNVSNRGVWHTIAAGATPDANGDLPVTRLRAMGTWNWDGTVRWHRSWVIVFAGSEWSPEGTYGDGAFWGDGGTWGSTATLEQGQDMLREIRKWKGQHVYVPSVIVSFDDTLFDPTNPVSLPDGEWANYGKDDGAGNWVPARFTAARYTSGVI